LAAIGSQVAGQTQLLMLMLSCLRSIFAPLALPALDKMSGIINADPSEVSWQQL
jgi:hypothetical protein